MFKAICFTGHRDLPVTEDLKRQLYDALEEFIRQGAIDFYAGAALGWDTLCELVILKLKKVYPYIKLHLILPCSNEEQTTKWTEVQKIEFFRILNLADSVEYTSKHYHNECMKIRNARLVELADCCVCYYDGRFRSGTAQTVSMAQKKHIMVINFFDT